MFPNQPIADLIGTKVGILTVISFHGYIGHRRQWMCECECGKKRICQTNVLVALKVYSCGCRRSNGRYLVIRGESMTVKQAAARFGLDSRLIYKRMKEYGWTDHKCVIAPAERKKVDLGSEHA